MNYRHEHRCALFAKCESLNYKTVYFNYINIEGITILFRKSYILYSECVKKEFQHAFIVSFRVGEKANINETK